MMPFVCYQSTAFLLGMIASVMPLAVSLNFEDVAAQEVLL
jgi:hypothetical protein